MRISQGILTILTLILMSSLVFAAGNSSSPADSLNESQISENSSSLAIDQNASSPAVCGELIYFCSDDSPYCGFVEPEINKFIENSGCVSVRQHILPEFMQIAGDSLALEHEVNYVPAFIFVDENGCSGEVGFAGATKLEDIEAGIDNFQCGSSPTVPPKTPTTPECPSYKCDGGFSPKCEIINSQCACESCPAIPVEPNSSTGPIEIPEVENPQAIVYECSGCSLNNQCYPFGYRKNETFCSDSGNQFIEQRESDSTCENNFECSSNLCIDDRCVSSGLWQKILRWFSHLF